MFDATAAAAHYLCRASGRDLSGDAAQRRAVFAYNHLDSYVADVLAFAAAYRRGASEGTVAIVPITYPKSAATASPTSARTTAVRRRPVRPPGRDRHPNHVDDDSCADDDYRRAHLDRLPGADLHHPAGHADDDRGVAGVSIVTGVAAVPRVTGVAGIDGRAPVRAHVAEHADVIGFVVHICPGHRAHDVCPNHHHRKVDE